MHRKRLPAGIKITNWNPFSFLLEDDYSRHARMKRSAWTDSYFDTWRVLSGDGHQIDSITVGMIDYVIFLHFIYIIGLTDLFLKLDTYVDNERDIEAPIASRILAVLALITLLPSAIVLGSLTAVMSVPLTIPVHLYFQHEGAKLKKIIDTYEKNQKNVLTLTFYNYGTWVYVDPVAGLGLYERPKNGFFDSPRYLNEENKKIDSLRFGISTLTIVHNLETPKFNGAWESVITLSKDNPLHIKFWQAMRELNIGHVNEKIRQEKFEFSETANIFNQARCVYQILWRAAKTGNGFFKDFTFPKEMVLEIVKKAFQNELCKAIDEEVKNENKLFENFRKKSFRSSFSDNFKSRQMPADWLFEDLKPVPKKMAIQKFIKEGVKNNRKRLLAMRDNGFFYQQFVVDPKYKAKKQPENILSLRRR